MRNSVNPDDGMMNDSSKRKCTDLFFLIIFICMCISLVLLSKYGYENGNIAKLTAPLDGDLNFCGITPGYEEYSKLYITNFDGIDVFKIFKSAVCVKKCPIKGDKSLDCKVLRSGV